MRRGGRWCAAASTLALACLAACTVGSPPDVAPTRAAPLGTGQPSTPSADPGPRPTQPLVMVTHATRPPLELSLRRAEELRDRAVRGSRARAAVRAVEEGRARLAVVPARFAGPTVRAAQVAGLDPFRRPERYPLQVTGPAPPERPVSLTVTGDLMLTRGVPDPVAALAPMRRRLRGADLTVGNLESTLSRAGPPQQGGDSFGAEPSLVGVLADAGLDAVSLANNHTGDFGEQALLETVRRLADSSVEPFGAGRDLRAAGRPAILEAHGVRYGFLGFNAIGETPRAMPGTPGALSVRMPPRTGPLQETDLAHVTGLVRRLDRRVDAVVVLPHWGDQYTHRPEPVQREVARALVEAGADLVVGGHPHWVQGVDVVDGTPVLHSLGNYVFDMDFAIQTMQGVLLETTWWGDELKALELVPYRMDAQFAPRPAAPAEAADILGDVWSTSTGPFSVPAG